MIQPTDRAARIWLRRGLSFAALLVVSSPLAQASRPSLRPRATPIQQAYRPNLPWSPALPPGEFLVPGNTPYSVITPPPDLDPQFVVSPAPDLDPQFVVFRSADIDPGILATGHGRSRP